MVLIKTSTNRMRCKCLPTVANGMIFQLVTYLTFFEHIAFQVQMLKTQSERNDKLNRLLELNAVNI